jgi:hypothetical protein
MMTVGNQATPSEPYGTMRSGLRARARSQTALMGIRCVSGISKAVWYALHVPPLRAMFPQISEMSDRRGFFPTTEEEARGIRSTLVARGFDVQDYDIDRAAYLEYLRKAMPEYESCAYLGLHFPEKLLEHYLSFEFLQVNTSDHYVDIASANSPTPEIARRLFGCEAFRQDLRFPEGIHGDRIGGDAANMAVPDGFVSKATLHCSFEHFSGDADVRLVRRASRLLRSGGRLCILPLYLNRRYAIATDLAWWPIHGRPTFESGAPIYYVKNYMSVHGRNYDVEHLDERIRQNLGDLRLKIYYIRNQQVVDPRCYVKFVALLTKP